MNLHWEDGDVVFAEMDEFHWQLLLRLPEAANPKPSVVRARLFGGVTGGKDPAADEDWREFVAPELEGVFETHVGAVMEDLKKGSGEEDARTLRIPAEHLHAWIHTLNQGRLALAALHDVNEADMEGRRRIRSPEKAFAFLQIEIYGELLSYLLFHTDL